ncbi:MAG: M48 family metalloprotease [Candidatus Bathyarchaeota archaeon]|nr:M48 family metalloprotease [Candidatus Bathyarchaeota archaeon]
MAGDVQLSEEQSTFLKTTLGELAKKAGLRKAPEFYISKRERLASVNVFQKRISIGEHMLKLWKQGKFSDNDIKATIAHEIGHLMDFMYDSGSPSFRNLLFESLWVSFGVVPIVLYILSPSLTWLAISALMALGWGFSLPWIIRGVEVRIELEADRKAALYLVEPQQLATALEKISSFGMPPDTIGFKAKLSFLAGTLTHPTFKERVRYLQNL